MARPSQRRWVASSGIMGDLIRSRDRAAAAREASAPKKGVAATPEQADYLQYLETAVSALDGAIGIAEKNLPKIKPISEEASFG